ncbi:MAG: hypothetical protein KAX74_00685, partial [Sphaerotilus sp.]|nr:hypothetical protein [Sphaerotilus sp.]
WAGSWRRVGKGGQSSAGHPVLLRIKGLYRFDDSGPRCFFVPSDAALRRIASGAATFCATGFGRKIPEAWQAAAN